MIVCHLAILVHGIFVHFPNVDEIGHLPASTAPWLFSKFDLYRVSPPLVHFVSGIPSVTRSIPFDWLLYSDHVGARPEFNIGVRYLERTGLTFQQDFFMPRICCLVFSILGASILTSWSYRVLGFLAAHVVCLFWCFCPNILAHAQTIIPDVGSVSIGVLACYATWQYTQVSSRWNASFAGFALGLALLSKLTWITGFVSLPGAAALAIVANKTKLNSRSVIDRVSDLFIFVSIAIFILNAGYLFEGSFSRVASYTFCSKSLGGQEASPSNPGNRFEGTVLESVPVPFPRNFLLGIDYLKYEVETKYWSFLLGEWRKGSWWYYYVVTTLVKTPVPMLIAATLGLLVLIMSKDKDVLSMFLVIGIPAGISFLSVSLQGGFNHHHRYVLGIYPTIYFLGAVLVSRRIAGSWISKIGIVLCLSSAISSLSVWPHFLSYFNWTVGGPQNGWKVLGFSNVDWGQDFALVDRWLKTNPEHRPALFQLGYHGKHKKLFGLESDSPPGFPLGTSIDEVRKSIKETQWWIVAVTDLHNLPDQAGLQYLQQIEPVERIAYAYHVYRIDPLPPEESSSPNEPMP
ncbi:hypothetical protein SH449x_004229 [Pirellulaceae bacterium SH449]